MTGSTARALLAVLALTCVAQIEAHAELSFDPTWQLVSAEAAKQQVLVELKTRQLTEAQQADLDKLWAESSSRRSLLDRTIESLALVDEQVAQLITLASQPYDGPQLPSLAVFSDQTASDFTRQNAQLYYARWLAQNRLYDEVIGTLEGLKVTDVVDPAALLFYKAVAYQQIVQPEKSRAALVTLLEQQSTIPRRYQQVAQLIERDLANLDDESLQHVAKRMDDIGRRLSMGRAGDRVQVIERGVLDDLNKMIKQEEERQQQQQQKSNSPGDGTKPMEESRHSDLKGPGKVDNKRIGKKSGWGDLPPKERQQALQQIGRDFPAHYREIIEEYFRELAAEEKAAGR